MKQKFYIWGVVGKNITPIIFKNYPNVISYVFFAVFVVSALTKYPNDFPFYNNFMVSLCIKSQTHTHTLTHIHIPL